MSILTEAIRRHHASMGETLEAHAHAVGGSEPQIERGSFVAFLKGDLLPHARGEERHLYEAVDTLVREHGSGTATMMVDHEFIAGYVRKIEELTCQLKTAPGHDRALLLRRLRDLSLRLEAIVQLHLAKEERVYLPLLDRYLDETRQRQILERVHKTYEEA